MCRKAGKEKSQQAHPCSKANVTVDIAQLRGSMLPTISTLSPKPICSAQGACMPVNPCSPKGPKLTFQPDTLNPKLCTLNSKPWSSKAHAAHKPPKFLHPERKVLTTRVPIQGPSVFNKAYDPDFSTNSSPSKKGKKGPRIFGPRPPKHGSRKILSPQP